jgi:hypothetical protein
MDIMKLGSGVEVIATQGLKNKVKSELDKAAKLYSK